MEEKNGSKTMSGAEGKKCNVRNRTGGTDYNVNIMDRTKWKE